MRTRHFPFSSGVSTSFSLLLCFTGLIPNLRIVYGDVQAAEENWKHGSSPTTSERVSTVPFILEEKAQLPQNASSFLMPTLSRRVKRNTAAGNANAQLEEALAEIKGLKWKVNVLRSQVKVKQRDVERLDKVNKLLLEENKELAWLKTTYLNDNWDSKLHVAVNNKDEEAVKKLVQEGAYLNPRNKQLKTPLHRAALGSDKAPGLRIIKYLINSGADVLAMDNGNRTFLHSLVGGDTTITPSQFTDITKFLISKNMATLFNTPGWSSGDTPILEVLKNVEVESSTLSLMHNNGVNLNVVNKDVRQNILIYALVGNRSITLISKLVALGVNPKHVNKNNQSALHTAASKCHSEGVKYFIDQKLDVNSLDRWKVTPLHMSMQFSKCNTLKTVRVLIENGANLKLRDYAGKTPLDRALARTDMVEKDKVIQLLRDNE